jgi:tetratricopeptide (TPR) repeat protein
MAAYGCGGTKRGAATTVRLAAACPAGQYPAGDRCAPRKDPSGDLTAGAKALADFEPEKALPRLQRAKGAGPHRWRDYVRLYEQLGIAYAYMERKAEALAAFDMLLSLDPAHFLDYELGPKATLLFAKARQIADKRGAARLEVNWPRDLRVTEPIPLELEVVRDPKSLLERASIRVRRRGEKSFRRVELRLPDAGGYRRVLLPAPKVRRNEVLELYVTAFDKAGNEVLHWASPERPREIQLRYQPATPWYRKWWVWAAIGGGVTAVTATTVYFATREPPDIIGGGFGFGD